jgi:hypothetical protein
MSPPRFEQRVPAIHHSATVSLLFLVQPLKPRLQRFLAGSNAGSRGRAGTVEPIRA